MAIKRRNRARLAKRLEAALELPTGTLHRTLRLEISGNRQAIVEGCSRILQYDEDCIRMETVGGEIGFSGERLCVNGLSGGSAVVAGRFVTIRFEEEC